MEDSKRNQELLDIATKMYAAGYDNRYIELQMAEKGYDDATIDWVLKEITKLKKAVKRREGRKKVITGLSICALAIICTSISFRDNSPMLYILYGSGAMGVLTTMKGIAEIIGLI